MYNTFFLKLYKGNTYATLDWCSGHYQNRIWMSLQWIPFSQIIFVFDASNESVLTKSAALGLSKESLRSDGWPARVVGCLSLMSSIEVIIVGFLFFFKFSIKCICWDGISRILSFGPSKSATRIANKYFLDKPRSQNYTF